MASVSSVARAGRGLEATLANGHTVQAQKILVAMERLPQIEGLGLVEIGVEFDSAGWVRVDDRYATTTRGYSPPAM
jgi:pyruvate/2-oxoglutarate dehydrogenase complex dihydrolipoamide dehydrogenase (E3) component